MKFSTKIRYGIRTMLEISLNEREEGILQKEIAARQNLSFKYLDQIISALKTSGLITNVKGKKSGYKLTRKPSDISILDIHNAFEPCVCIVDCLSEHVDCPIDKRCAPKVLWDGLNRQIEEYLSSNTLQDLKDKQIELNSPEKEL